MGGKSLKGTLSGGAMLSVVIDVIEPQIKGFVEFL